MCRLTHVCMCVCVPKPQKSKEWKVVSDPPAIHVVRVVIYVSQLFGVSAAFHLFFLNFSRQRASDRELARQGSQLSPDNHSLKYPLRQPRMASAMASLTAGLTPQQVELLKDQNHDTEVYTCAAVFSILAIVAVIVRVTSRHMKKVAVGIDDVLVFVALVSVPIPLGLNNKYVIPGTKADIVSR